MKLQLSAAACLVVILSGCQSTSSDTPDSRVTLYRPGSTPTERRIAYSKCEDESFRTSKDAKARAQFIRGCMQDKGYALLENLPVCSTEAARRRALRAPQPLKQSQMTCSSGVALDRY